MSKSLSISRNGVTIGQEERIERSLDGTLPPHIPPVTPAAISNISKARIRRSLAELANGNVDKVQAWLDAVANGTPDEVHVVEGPDGAMVKQINKGRRADPAEAIRLYLDLVEFSVPKLKAIAIDIKDGDGRALKTYTMEELQAKVIAEQ